MQSVKSTAGRCLRNGPPDWILLLRRRGAGRGITVTAVVVPSLSGPLQIESATGGANDVTDDLSAPVNIAAAPTDVQITGFASTGNRPGEARSRSPSR